MKRAKKLNTWGTHTGSADKDLTREQLEGIGKVVISYNQVEALFYVALSIAANLQPKLSLEITSRINGLEGVAEIIKRALVLNCPSDVRAEIVGSVTRFMELKEWRDAIIHTKPFIPKFGLGVTNAKRGKVHETLITIEVLSGVYARSEILREEMLGFISIVSAYSGFFDRGGKSKLSEQQTAELLEPYLAEYRTHHQARQALSPLPQFPEIPLEDQGPDY